MASCTRLGCRRRIARAGPLGLAAAIGIIALVFLGNGVYLKAKALLAQHLIARAWNNPGGKPWPWADTRPVARLNVPRLGVDLYLLEGDNLRTLAFGPGHRSATPLPGDPGNSLIGGHRDTHFKFLRDLKPGDVLLVENAKGLTLRFVVENCLIADKNDPRWLAPSDDPMLTLVTCYPFDALTPGGPLRYIVTARFLAHLASFPKNQPVAYDMQAEEWLIGINSLAYY